MKIKGRTVGTTMPRPDWSQTDPKKADYIYNKPKPVVYNETQTLSDEQKRRARNNIGAVGTKAGELPEFHAVKLKSQDSTSKDGVMIGYAASENYFGVATFKDTYFGTNPVILRNIAPGTASYDAVNKLQMDSAISTKAVRYDMAYPYTEEQQAQARENIGAADKETLLQETDPCVMDMNTEFAQGYLDTSTGNFIAHSNHRTSDFIELEDGVVYQCDIEFINNQGDVQTYATVGYYNADQSFSRWASMPVDITRIALKNDEKYIRMWISGQQVNLLRMYPKDVGYEPVVTLNPNLEIPQLDREIERVSNGFSPYIHARRPVIAFILDGEYDRNATMEAIFSRHNMRIGFAPQYTTTFANNSKETYLAWQEKGHEILAHGTYILREDNYTDEQIAEYIKASYTTFKGYRFDVHGFIGSSGKVDAKYVPLIKQYYDYAATENNHTGSGSITESCLFFGTDGPYNLWRYSIQRSTLDQAKAAVDRALETGGLVLFMGHAQSSDIDQLTDENVEALLSYIEEVGVTVKTPYEAVKDYYSIRYEDIVGQSSV